MLNSETSRNAETLAFSKGVTPLLLASVLFACGSLDEIGGSRANSDGSVPTNGGPASLVVDSSVPQPPTDAGVVSALDARLPANDASVPDSTVGADATTGLPDTGAPPPPPPQRVVFVHIGHGFGRRSVFTPAGSRSDPQLVNALEPLSPFVDRTLVIDGINANPFPLNPDSDPNRPCRSSVPHSCPQSLLSGMYRDRSATQPRTVDHRVAEWLGAGVREPFSIVATTSQRDPGNPARTTYDDSEQAIPPVTEPADYLSVITDTPIPSPSIEAAALLSSLESELADVDKAEARASFFARAIAAKIAFGATHVVTWNLAHTQLFLEVAVDAGGYPDTVSAIDHLSNSVGNPGAILALKRWCIAQLAELVTRLDEMPEGSGTVLDSTLVVFYTDSIGIHGPQNAPVIVVGGGAPSLRFGEYISLTDGFSFGDDRMIDVMATIVSALGMDIDGIGPPGAPARILPELLR